MLALNLIPPQLKAEHQTIVVWRRWFSALRVLLILVIIGTAGSVAVWRLLVRHEQVIRDDFNRLQQQGIGAGTDITTTTSKLNTTIQTISATLGTPQSWTELTRTVLDGLPSGATVSTFVLNPGGVFQINGLADSRQTFINLEQALKNNPRLKNITTTSSASKRTAVPFDFSGTVLPAIVTP
jgi:Tfp pilus assembly protein PilN